MSFLLNDEPGVTPPTRVKVTFITIRYAGDTAGCTLFLSIRLGNRTFNPSGSVFPVANVPLGHQRYIITGNIGCTLPPLAGRCTAAGQGQLNVVNGGTYDVVWRNTGVGQCTVALQQALY